MAQKTAGIIGATGLIGSHIVELLKNDPAFETVRLIVRRLVSPSEPKFKMKLVNFEDYESVKLAIDGCDVLFCAVGTTLKKVKGDKIAYRKADYDVPVNAARACLETGCSQFLLVSSVGADAAGNNFYLRLKGEAEEAIQKFPILSVSIFRPSILLGHRKESRPGERIGQIGAKLLSPLLPGQWHKYKPIEAKEVAAAMIAAARQMDKGVTIFQYDEMKRLLNKS